MCLDNLNSPPCSEWLPPPLDDRKNFQFYKRGIGIESESMQTSYRSKKYGNKLKLEFSDHRTMG